MAHTDHNATLPAFGPGEEFDLKVCLASRVASMLGRKMEEGDWTSVYCRAKGIPEAGWSNLNIDVICKGLGVEHKLLRCSTLRGRPIKSVCGTTLMHPAATRSIRIENVERNADLVMGEVLAQYNALIDGYTSSVRKTAPETEPDMRIGWLLWEDSLSEFLYFENILLKLNITEYYAEWNVTPARGARKGSKSLWIYDRYTNQKRYSVTTSAGIKIQPYFKVPSPSDPNLYFFRVQSEPVDSDTVNLWVSAMTARNLRRILGELSKDVVSKAILDVARSVDSRSMEDCKLHESAVPIPVSVQAFNVFCSTWDGVSDEHRAQLFSEALYLAGYS